MLNVQNDDSLEFMTALGLGYISVGTECLYYFILCIMYRFYAFLHSLSALLSGIHTIAYYIV